MDAEGLSQAGTEGLWEEYLRALLAQDYDSALSSLRGIDEREPDNPEVQIKMGDVMLKMNNIGGALDCYRKTASSLIGSGRLHKALEVCKMVLGIVPEDKAAMDSIVGILEELEEVEGESGELDQQDQEEADAEEAQVADEETDAGEADTPPSWSDFRIPEIFSSLSRGEFEGLAEASTFKTFRNSEDVFHEGDPGDSMYVILRGKALVTIGFRGSTYAIATLSEGDFFGEMALLTRRKRTATVTAFGALETLEIGREVLSRLVEGHPEVLKSLVGYHNQRLMDARKKISS